MDLGDDYEGVEPELGVDDWDDDPELEYLVGGGGDEDALVEENGGDEEIEYTDG